MCSPVKCEPAHHTMLAPVTRRRPPRVRINNCVFECGPLVSCGSIRLMPPCSGPFFSLGLWLPEFHALPPPPPPFPAGVAGEAYPSVCSRSCLLPSASTLGRGGPSHAPCSAPFFTYFQVCFHRCHSNLLNAFLFTIAHLSIGGNSFLPSLLSICKLPPPHPPENLLL